MRHFPIVTTTAERLAKTRRRPCFFPQSMFLPRLQALLLILLALIFHSVPSGASELSEEVKARMEKMLAELSDEDKAMVNTDIVRSLVTHLNRQIEDTWENDAFRNWNVAKILEIKAKEHGPDSRIDQMRGMALGHMLPEAYKKVPDVQKLAASDWNDMAEAVRTQTAFVLSVHKGLQASQPHHPIALSHEEALALTAEEKLALAIFVEHIRILHCPKSKQSHLENILNVPEGLVPAENNMDVVVIPGPDFYIGVFLQSYVAVGRQNNVIVISDLQKGDPIVSSSPDSSGGWVILRSENAYVMCTYKGCEHVEMALIHNPKHQSSEKKKPALAAAAAWFQVHRKRLKKKEPTESGPSEAPASSSFSSIPSHPRFPNK